MTHKSITSAHESLLGSFHHHTVDHPPGCSSCLANSRGTTPANHDVRGHPKTGIKQVGFSNSPTHLLRPSKAIQPQEEREYNGNEHQKPRPPPVVSRSGRICCTCIRYNGGKPRSAGFCG